MTRILVVEDDDRPRTMSVRTCLAKPFDVEGLLALVERYVLIELAGS